jgi:protein-L-isoaspartate(D-aspartate) O-methyltransferase
MNWYRKHFSIVILILAAIPFFLILTNCKKSVPQTAVSAEASKAEVSDPNWPRPRTDDRLDDRKKMVNHLRTAYRLEDPNILGAMLAVPRHWFVRPAQQLLAYADTPLPIGYDQTISQPFIVAYMTSLLELNENKKVLEIGTGSGYQAAVLNELTPHVYSIEIVEPLAKETAKILKEKGYTNIKLKIGDGYKGWKVHAPFDAIIVTAAPEQIPKPLQDQLKPGGIMIIPVGPVYRTQQLMLIRKNEKGDILTKSLIPVRFVPMIHGDDES